MEDLGGEEAFGWIVGKAFSEDQSYFEVAVFVRCVIYAKSN
jgi:hypothetical protein